MNSVYKSPNKDYVRSVSPDERGSGATSDPAATICRSVVGTGIAIEDGLPSDVFFTWKRGVLDTVSRGLSDGQRSALICVSVVHLHITYPHMFSQL